MINDKKKVLPYFTKLERKTYRNSFDGRWSKTNRKNIIDKFCKNEFEDYIYINFMESPNIVNIFDEKI